jgi:hypothetical protein
MLKDQDVTLQTKAIECLKHLATTKSNATNSTQNRHKSHHKVKKTEILNELSFFYRPKVSVLFAIRTV